MQHDAARARALADLPERYNAADDFIGGNLRAGRGARTAVIDARLSLTYAELSDRIDRAAAALLALGLRRDERVLLCLLDTAAFAIAFFACLKVGVIPVPLNTLLTTEDYAWLVEDSGARAVMVDAELSGKWRDIADSRPEVRFLSIDNGPWASLERLYADAAPLAAPADTHRDDVAFWQYTSGSTGKPKAAMHVHASPRLAANLFGAGVIGYRESDVVHSVAKQFFGYGLGNAAFFPFSVGATTVLNRERPTAAGVSDLMRRHGVTILHGVPTFYAAWFADGASGFPALRLGVSAGEALPAHLAEEFRKRFNADLIDGIGSTEMLHIFLSNRPGDVRPGCTGRPVPGYEARLVGDDGAPVVDGEIGELQVKGPTSAAGYWRNRDKSRATFAGEWTRTGDKFRRDAEGYYHYGGRSDDMLKVGGIYVAPSEVEAAIASHEGVLEAAVVGVPDKDGLIKPRAHVVLKPGVSAAGMEETLKAHVKARLAAYKAPRAIVFEVALPKTATGKIQRFRLRDRG
ncbi:MAG: benzoate-CoA ligase family protein [Parvularculaceae bacterium]